MGIQKLSFSSLAVMGFLGIANILALGCAVGGDGNALAPGAVGKGGNAHNNVNVAPSIGLGDEAVKAAASAASAGASSFLMNIDPVDLRKYQEIYREQAIEAGILAARKTTKTKTLSQGEENLIIQEAEKGADEVFRERGF